MTSDKHDKKRKRDSDRHERPSKKTALDLQRLPPLTASVVDDHSELAPVIGTPTCYILHGYMDNIDMDQSPPPA